MPLYPLYCACCLVSQGTCILLRYDFFFGKFAYQYFILVVWSLHDIFLLTHEFGIEME